jgi:hypothetical protein
MLKQSGHEYLAFTSSLSSKHHTQKNPIDEQHQPIEGDQRNFKAVLPVQAVEAVEF